MEYETWLLEVGTLARADGFKMWTAKPGVWWFEKWKAGATATEAVALALKEG